MSLEYVVRVDAHLALQIDTSQSLYSLPVRLNALLSESVEQVQTLLSYASFLARHQIVIKYERSGLSMWLGTARKLASYSWAWSRITPTNILLPTLSMEPKSPRKLMLRLTSNVN